MLRTAERSIYSNHSRCLVQHLMSWVRNESLWFLGPYVADVFEAREAFDGLHHMPILMGMLRTE